MATIVRVGQVWTNGKTKLKMVRIIPGQAYYEVVNGTLGGNKSGSGSLKKDNTPDSWGSEWKMETQSPDYSPDMEFFKKVPEGHCPCNILKAVCKYHC